MSTITIRTKSLGDKTLLRILLEHPMETGRRRHEQTGELVPAHFITAMTIELNGAPIVRADLTTGVSQNPYFSFRLNGAQAGDRISLVWHDTLGREDSATVVI